MPINLEGTGKEDGAMEPGMAETEIAQITDQWLQKESWEVYPEVVLASFPGRPDLIATRQGICQVIECKKFFNLSVVEQASRWRLLEREDQTGMPHLIWVVVQRGRARRSELLMRIMKEFGIGLVTIHKQPARELRFDGETEVIPQRYTLYRELAPKIQPGSRRSASSLITQLNPDMRIATPGARGGETEYMTPFKRTMGEIEKLLQGNPEKEFHIDHIVDHLNKTGGHHYGSDRSARTSIPPHLDRLGFPRSRQWGCWFNGKMETSHD